MQTILFTPKFYPIDFITQSPHYPQQLSLTTHFNCCSHRLLLQQQILKHSQWQLVCHWSGRPKLSRAYSS